MRRIAQDALSVGSWAKTMRIAQYNDKKNRSVRAIPFERVRD